jgi:hypothetical protein
MMEELRKQVRRAGRRLAFQRFVNVLGWCWTITFILAALIILIDKYFPTSVLAWGWGLAAVVSGFLAAVVWTYLVRRHPLEAAIEIDRRFGLKERVSSALAMPEEDLESEAGQTVLGDATRRVARLEISEKFPVKPPRRLLLPIVPIVVAFLVALLVNPPGVESMPLSKKPDDPAIVKPQVKKAAESVQRKLAERQEKAFQENGRRDQTNGLFAAGSRTGSFQTERFEEAVGGTEG